MGSDCQSHSVPVVTMTAWLPLAFIVQMASSRWKAIFDPSGDQTGAESALPGAFVRLVCPDPSAFVTYISSLPSRPVSNAIFCPFGDQLGWPASCARSVAEPPVGLTTRIASEQAQRATPSV